EALQGSARNRRRGRGVCQGRKSSGGRILRADAGARLHGTAGRRGGLSGRKSGDLGGDAESARRAGSGGGRAGVEKRRRDGTRDAAGRRIRAEIVSGFRGGSGGAFKENRKACKDDVEPRRR